MASTAQKRIWYAPWECNPDKMVRHPFPGVGRTWNLWVADATQPAWQVFTDAMTRHGYLFRESAGGTYKCRNIGGSNLRSLHSYGIAVDLNPSANPFGTTRTDMPDGFVDDLLATGLFRWGMDFKDPMHWEIDVPPSQIQEDEMTPAQEAKLDEVLALTKSNPQRVWSYPALSGTQAGTRISMHKQADRVYVGVEDLWVALQAGKLTELPIEQLEELGDIVADELARRLTQ